MDIDPDWIEVVFLRQCPFCEDKLKREFEKSHTLYRHNDSGRHWCKSTNFVNGAFRITKVNPWFLNDGYGWGGA